MSSLRAVQPQAVPADPTVGFRLLPHNIEAEQALLGAVLVDNEVCNRVCEFLEAEHFYEPVHGRIFATCAKRVMNGQLADPVTLRVLFEEDPALVELGGARYLARLAQAAETIINAVDYAREITDLALKRSLIRIGEGVVVRAHDKAREESGQVQIEAAEQELYQLAETGEVRGEFTAFNKVLVKAVGLIETAVRKKEQVTGVPTGLAGLDEKLGGLQPSDLLVLAARPSMGKTALALTIAANAARARQPAGYDPGAKHQNYCVGFFSLEMSQEQLATRLLSAESGISSDELRLGRIPDSDFHRVVRAAQELSEVPLFIDDTPALSIASLRTRARRLKRQQGLSMIVVDYLQLVRGPGTNQQQNRVQEVSEVSQGLKTIAKELSVPVLALSQLSRAVESREDKRPMLSDLRDSGSIEQDADVVMFIYREDYYLQRSEPKQRLDQSPERYQEALMRWKTRCEEIHNRAEVIIAKQRNGPIGTVHVQFDPSFGQFRNPEMADYGDRLA